MSNLTYSMLVWGSNINRLIKLQKRAIRIVSLQKSKSHTEPIFKELNLLKLQDILTLQHLKFYYKFRHNNIPIYLQVQVIMMKSLGVVLFVLMMISHLSTLASADCAWCTLCTGCNSAELTTCW